MEYTSKGVGNAALTTGIIGTALSVLNGGLGNLLGGIARPGFGPFPGGPMMDPGDRPVTRYEMGLHQQINDKNNMISQLNSQLYTNNYVQGTVAPINQALCSQRVINAEQTARLNCQQQQIGQLFGMTQLTIPNANLNPGYGQAQVFVAPPPFPPFVPPVTDATKQTAATTTTGG